MTSAPLGALLDFADFYGVSLDYLLGRDLAGEAAQPAEAVYYFGPPGGEKAQGMV